MRVHNLMVVLVGVGLGLGLCFLLSVNCFDHTLYQKQLLVFYVVGSVSSCL